MREKQLLTLIVLTAMTSLARIGETLDECKARYGDPVNASGDGTDAMFNKNGIIVAVEFTDNKADFVMYAKEKTNVVGIGEKFSNAEVETLLKSNGGDRQWSKLQTISVNSDWETDKPQLCAHLDAVKNHLMVATKECLDRKAKEKSDQDKKNLSSF